MFQKYTWIELNVIRARDFRPESYHPYNWSKVVVEPKPKKTDWNARRNIVFKNNRVFTNIQEVITRAKTEKTSLAIFKPTRILDVIIEETERDWNAKSLAYLKQASRQLSLFGTQEEIAKTFEIVHKLPYRFSYVFEDDTGKRSKLLIEDWEIGMLYFNCLKHACGDEKIATSKVKDKYLNILTKRDLHFFLGTTLRHHYQAKNPFIIIGVFYPPALISSQLALDI